MGDYRAAIPNFSSLCAIATLRHCVNFSLARAICQHALGRASCQNQDLRDYRIFRILPARLRLAGARPYSSWRNFRLWRKAQAGRNEILKIPLILKILILTNWAPPPLDSRFRGNDGERERQWREESGNDGMEAGNDSAKPASYNAPQPLSTIHQPLATPS